MLEVVVVDLGQNQGVGTNRERIRCYKCRGYDHFAKVSDNKSRKRNRLNAANVQFR